MDFSLLMHNEGYELTNRHLLYSVFTLGSCYPYAMRHWEISCLSESLSVRWGHRMIACIEFLPVLGGLVAVIERVAIYVLINYRAVITQKIEDLHQFQNLLELNEIPPFLHKDPILSKFICPISQCPIRHPVWEPNHKVIYERSFILRWVNQHFTSPMTRLPLTADDLKPLPAINSLIEHRLGVLERLIQASLAKRQHNKATA